MLKKLLFAVSSCFAAHQALAQETEPLPTTEVSKWHLYVEAGPKTSRFKQTYQGTNTLVQLPAGYRDDYYREFQVDNTYSAFVDVKAFKPLSKHLVFSGAAGLDMQQLDFTTSLRSPWPPFRQSDRVEHVVRLLTRVRLDAGLHYAFGLGATGQLMPGVALGQMINVSRNGFGYSFIQPELCYTFHNVLLSVRASYTPYNTVIPDIEDIARRNDRLMVERSEYRITELQFGIGVKL